MFHNNSELRPEVRIHSQNLKATSRSPRSCTDSRAASMNPRPFINQKAVSPLSRTQVRVSEPHPCQTAKIRASFLMSQNHIFTNNSEPYFSCPRLHYKWELRLNQELSATWVYYSWSCPIKMTKDYIFTNSQGVRLWKLSSSRKQRVRLIPKDKERIKMRQEFNEFY